MTRCLKKSQKPYFGTILGYFCLNLERKSLEKMVLSVFKYYNYLTSCKKLEKTNDPFGNRHTDNSDFIRPPVGHGSKKKNSIENVRWFCTI